MYLDLATYLPRARKEAFFRDSIFPSDNPSAILSISCASKMACWDQKKTFEEYILYQHVVPIFKVNSA